MNPTPKGWPRISSCLYYQDPAEAIRWLIKVFGFELRLLVEGEGGSVEHSELTYGEGLIMVGGAGKSDRPGQEKMVSPATLAGGNTQSLCVYVDDVDSHHDHAVSQGARVVREPATHDYGDDYWSDRSYGVLDVEGHLWWFMQRIRG